MRPILPKFVSPPGHGGGGGRNSKSTSGKRSRHVTQACKVCRQIKAKCDGARPRCGSCITKDKLCGYDGEAGQSRQTSARLRLESLESLVNRLQHLPLDEATQLLDQIRSSDNPTSVARSDGESGSSPSGSSAPTTSADTTPSETDKQIALPADLARIRTQDRLAGSSLPGRSITLQAVSSFFDSSGKLFHVIPYEQVLHYLEVVYNDDPSRVDRVAMTCVAAVAAVGCQYSTLESLDANTSESFYNVARYHFEALLENNPLDAVRVCTLLSMYNIMEKSTVALAYVNVGLGIYRRYDMETSDLRPQSPGMSSETASANCHRSFRTLMFFSSWLSVTLGYMPEKDVGYRGITNFNFPVTDSAEISDVVQTELAKLCILVANILRMHLIFKDLTTGTAEAIMLDLEAWHGQLPAALHLDAVRANGRDYPDEARRSIYHLHLLYQGAIILLHRRIAAQVVKSTKLDQVLGGMACLPFPTKLQISATQGVLAAKQSAVILKELLSEDGIFKQCWLVINQAYTAAIVILHCVAQKQAYRLLPAEWSDDLDHVRSCLSVLDYCSSVDLVARRFYQEIVPIYHQLEGHQHPNPTASASVSPATPPPDYLLSIPPHAPQAQVDLSLRLLILLCQPFRDAEMRAEAEQDVMHRWKADPTRYTYGQMVERLTWQVEKGLSFEWDVEKITGSDFPGTFSGGSGRFLTATEPQYWSGGAGFMRHASPG